MTEIVVPRPEALPLVDVVSELEYNPDLLRTTQLVAEACMALDQPEIPQVAPQVEVPFTFLTASAASPYARNYPPDHQKRSVDHLVSQGYTPHVSKYAVWAAHDTGSRRNFHNHSDSAYGYRLREERASLDMGWTRRAVSMTFDNPARLHKSIENGWGPFRESPAIRRAAIELIFSITEVTAERISTINNNLLHLA